jgi:hypothetical protein
VIYVSVVLVSLASLAYEALLPRIFSFTQWHHLAFLVISVAVFGFGAGGGLVSLAEGRRRGLAARLVDPSRPGALAALSLLFCLSAAGSLAFLLRVPLDYFRLPVDGRQACFLALTWLLLLLPFLLAGAVQALAFAALPQRAGWLYAAGMGGGACGAVLPAALLAPLGEVRLALACLALPALPWVLGVPRPGAHERAAGRTGRTGRILTSCAALAVTGLLALAAWRPPELRPSPYKLLAQAEQMAGTRLLSTQNSLAGRIDWLDSPALRFAPGMSLAFPGGLPQPEQAVLDGDGLVELFPLLDPSRLAFCRYTTSYAAYDMKESWAGRRALLVLESGGLALPCAVTAGVGSIEVLLRHPELARRLRESGGGLSVVQGGPRAFLARSRESFDLVHLESWGPSVPGMASLTQDNLLTLEGFTALLRRLSPEGLFTVSRRIQLPPSDSLRLLATAAEALRFLGSQDPGSQLAMIRSWDSYTLIASAHPFRPPQLERLRRFAAHRSFDLMFLRGLTEQEAGRFIQYDRPYHFLELERLGDALKQGRPEGFYRSYLLDVRPATDERPFPNRFTKWLRIGELYRATGSRPFSLLLSGEAVLLATLALALLIGLPLLFGLPALLPRARASLPAGALLLFLACGAGYMLVEMGVIQDLTLLFAEPVTAVTITLAVLLVFSGVGAAVSGSWRKGVLPVALGALAAVLGLLAGVHHLLLEALLTLGPGWRLAATALALAPAGLLLGVPLPAALRGLGGGGARRAYAWAVNGIAGVLASVLALPLAMGAGVRSVYLAAAASYLAALAAALWPIWPRSGLRES